MSRYQFPSAGTTDASLLVSGTLSDARLSANVALENVANVFSAKQSFSGTTHVGLCLNSLTTAEYNALTPANGDLYRDSTTDRIDARLARGTVELVDTAGGQTITGALTATGSIQATSFWSGAGNNTIVNAAGGSLFLQTGGVNRWQINSNHWVPVTTNVLDLGSTTQRVRDLYVGGVNATGNLTASGTLRVGGGTVVTNILSATATLDFGSIATNDTHTLTITVTGAVAGDSVFLGVPAGLDAGLIFCASVTAANTVTVRMHNSSGGSIDPASGTFRATVIRF